MRLVIRVFAAVALLLAASGLLFAQATATISGRVIDQGKAVLPGVTVTVTSPATGVVRDTVSNAEGLFSFPALTPGIYEVRAEITGFAPSVRRVDLVTSSTLTVDFELGLAQLAESLTVQAAMPLVETTQSMLSSSVRQTEVMQLPMINRSLAAMMTLLPGAREVPAQGSHGHAAGYVSFAGNAGRSYNMYVDGVDNKEDQDGGTLVQYSLEGIEEFRALGAGFQAEYGRGSTVVVLATKSGTNRFRGTAFGFGRNESLTATDFFSKPENGGLGKQPFKRVQWGGSMGGPILRDRAWFFGSVEKIVQDFSLPRPENLIREHRYLEALNIGIKVTDSVPQPFRDLLFQAKVNAQVGQNHSVFLRYGSQNGYVDNPAITAGRTLFACCDFVYRNDQTLWSTAAGWTWIASPTAVNELRVQYAYYFHDELSGVPCPDQATCIAQKLSFPSVATGVNFGTQIESRKGRWTNFEEKFEIMNNFSKQVGRHSLKFGVDYARLPVFYADLSGGSPGSIAFFDDPSVIVNNTNGKYPQGFQTPGIVRSIAVSSGTQAEGRSNKAWFAAAYVQDDFKVTPKLTLNLGVRYDINEMSNNCCWDQNRMGRILREIGHPFGQLPKTDKNNLAPRVGLAYDVRGDGRDVARASFGLFYATGIITSVYSSDYQSAPVVYFTQTLANSTVGSGQLADYVYGVSPLPTAPLAPTEFPRGQSVVGSWLHPDFEDAVSQNTSFGLSHLFRPNTVLSVDYLHVLVLNGWWGQQINPLLDDDNNPATRRVRPLSALTQAKYGDPNLFGPSSVLTSKGRGLYDGVDVHFEHRFSRTAFQVNYTLAWARGKGGSTDFTTQGGAETPQSCDILGCDIDAPGEWGPTAYDERHRVTMAGVIPLPFGFDVAPSFTVATARPYTQFRAPNPNGNGSLRILNEDGTSVGVRNARGKALINTNARVTKHLQLPADRQISLFAEFYNMLNRANFGNSFGGNAFAPGSYNKPNGYLGGIGSTSTLPISFQMQFGARFSF